MSIEQTPPPENTEKGWKSDPLGVGELRWWDGEKWGNQITKAKKSKDGMGAGKKWLIGIGIGLVVLIGIGALAGEDDKSSDSTATEKSASSTESSPSEDVADEKPVAEDKPEPAPVKEEPEMTPGQENAIQTADDYLGYSSFSKKGLIDQLVFDGYSKSDAKFAVNHLSVDWKEQAYQTAKDYLDYSSFSLSALVDQLVFDGYTQTQADYGANKAYNGG